MRKSGKGKAASSEDWRARQSRQSPSPICQSSHRHGIHPQSGELIKGEWRESGTPLPGRPKNNWLKSKSNSMGDVCLHEDKSKRCRLLTSTSALQKYQHWIEVLRPCFPKTISGKSPQRGLERLLSPKNKQERSTQYPGTPTNWSSSVQRCEAGAIVQWGECLLCR